MKQPHTHRYKGHSFTANFVEQEDKQWHGYGHVDIGYETVQVAGQPAADRATACRNTLLAIRQFIDQHTD
jgi:hypothetical protein